MKKYKVNLTEQFNEEIDKILNTSFYSRKMINKIYKKIRDSILSLKVFPERYYRISNIKKYRSANIRRMPIKKFILIYEVRNDTRRYIYFTYILWWARLFKSIIIIFKVIN